MEQRKLIIINDSLRLPQLGWGSSFYGPVTHPTYFENDVLERLLRSNPPVKFMYAINPENMDQRVLLTLENFMKDPAEIFNITETVVETVIPQNSENENPINDQVIVGVDVSKSSEEKTSVTEHEISKDEKQPNDQMVADTVNNETENNGTSTVDPQNTLDDKVSSANAAANIRNAVNGNKHR